VSQSDEYEEYVTELRNAVCSHCIERQPDCPPCEPHGKGCGIELHVPRLVELCRSMDSAQMEPYIDQLHDTICTECDYRDTPSCPCPLEYLLQMAVEAIECVERRRVAGQPPT